MCQLQLLYECAMQCTAYVRVQLVRTYSSCDGGAIYHDDGDDDDDVRYLYHDDGDGGLYRGDGDGDDELCVLYLQAYSLRAQLSQLTPYTHTTQGEAGGVPVVQTTPT